MGPRAGVATRLALVAALLCLTSCSSSTAVPPADPASIELSSTNVSLASLLATHDLIATVRDVNGTPISASVTWSTSAPGVATVSNAGRVTAIANGTTQITASAGTVQSPATTVTVQQVAAMLTLTPDTLRLAAASDTATIGRTVRDAGGSTMTGVPVTFATVDPSVATVVPSGATSGRVTAQADGATTITAQAAVGVTDNVRVEVGGDLPPAFMMGGFLNVAYSDLIDPASGGGPSFTYTVTAGALPPGLSLNSTSRQITGTPTVSGVHFFQVTATNGVLTLSERFAITISTKVSTAFNFWVTYNGGAMPPLNTRIALSAAVARLENIITGDPGATVTYPSSGFEDQCILVTGALLHNAVVEDVAILMALDSIDGAGKTLARAGFCGRFRASPPVITTGQMLIDEADANASATYLEDVIWHEIGHVLGVGTLQNFTTGVGTPTPTFNGPNAKAEWTTLSDSTTNVPMEPDLAGHWHEGWFNAEIMTPITEGSSVRLPISRLTIGALIDFGWTASLGAADAYTLPGCLPTCTIREPAGASGEGVRIPDFVIEKVVPLPPGAAGRN